MSKCVASSGWRRHDFAEVLWPRCVGLGVLRLLMALSMVIAESLGLPEPFASYVLRPSRHHSVEPLRAYHIQFAVILFAFARELWQEFGLDPCLQIMPGD